MSKKFTYSNILVNTPQSKPVPAKSMVKNNANGYVFKLNHWDYLRRFLILGSEGNTYYTNQKELTYQNVTNVIKCVDESPIKALELASDVSNKGLAHRNDPAIFVLALVLSNRIKVPHYFMDTIVRTGSHYLLLIFYIKNLGKWTKKVKAFCRQWYNKDLEALTYQLIKYQNRHNFTQRDALRLVHPNPMTAQYSLLFKWVTNRNYFKQKENLHELDDLPLVQAFMEIHDKDITVKKAIELISTYRLTHEMIPTRFKTYPEIWEALFEHMPAMATIRNLNIMTANGFLTPHNYYAIDKIEKRINDFNRLKKARVHPMAILLALKTYSTNYGYRSKLFWNHIPKIADILDSAFYKSFKLAEPTGKHIMLALDVSYSMSGHMLNTSLTYCEATAAMALITANIEQHWAIYGFSNKFTPLPITPKMRLDEATKKTIDFNFGTTDAALPMIWARKRKAFFDCFIIYTDNETWCGKTHPFQALQKYRSTINPDAKLIVVGMTPTPFTIADPSDQGMLDCVGFSTEVPLLISNFVKGAFND